MHKDFPLKTIALTALSKQVLVFFHEALTENNLQNSPYFHTLTQAALAQTTWDIPACNMVVDPLKLNQVHRAYQMKINLAFMSLNFQPQDTEKPILDNHFAVVRDLLGRLVALICARSGNATEWYKVYAAFANKLNQSKLLHSDDKVTDFNQLLSDQGVNTELKQTAEHLDKLNKAIDRLPVHEQKELEEYRMHTGLKALSILTTRTPELVNETYRADILEATENHANNTQEEEVDKDNPDCVVM